MVNAEPRIDGPEAFAAHFPVSRETIARLEAYAALLIRWQKTINLVAPSTVNHIWHRHFADSAQVYFASLGAARVPAGSSEEGQNAPLALPRVPAGAPKEGQNAPRPFSRVPAGSPEGSGNAPRPFSRVPAGSPEGSRNAPLKWLDIGSGAGFPGLVTAILAAGEGRATTHTLLESDSRKAAFLREAARVTGVVVDILCMRIEKPETRAKVGEVNCVTARALAPLPRLIELAYPFFGPDTTGLFLKGREVASEIAEAQREWAFTHDLLPSVTDGEGRILLLQSLQRRQ